MMVFTHIITAFVEPNGYRYKYEEGTANGGKRE
jgi:hypothetical protein